MRHDSRGIVRRRPRGTDRGGESKAAGFVREWSQACHLLTNGFTPLQAICIKLNPDRVWVDVLQKDFHYDYLPLPLGFHDDRAKTEGAPFWRQGVPPFDQMAGCSTRSEEHTSELQSLRHLVCRLLLEKK